MEWWLSGLFGVAAYLIGMAFAGSFLGRKWMGTVDVFLHRVLKREVTLGKYLYWKHFCNIGDPPKPPSLTKPDKLRDIIISKLLLGT
jgi:hypothetical protein